MSILLNSFEATRVDRIECLDTQSKPPRLLLVCHGRALRQEWTIVCLCQCTVETDLQKQGLDASSFLKSRDSTALKTRLIFHKADAMFSRAGKTRTSLERRDFLNAFMAVLTRHVHRRGMSVGCESVPCHDCAASWPGRTGGISPFGARVMIALPVGLGNRRDFTFWRADFPVH